MAKIQLLAFVKKPAFILSLLCLVFFLKGVFLAALYPLFFGPDEAKHYNTIQYLSEPKEKNWAINEIGQNIDNKKIETYNFTEEIEKTALAVNFDDVRWKTHISAPFSREWIGQNEREINEANRSRLNKDYPPSLVGKTKLYHSLASQIEKFFSDNNLFTRFYAIRIFSVLIGTICLLLFYLTAKTSGFSPKNSLLITAIIAFQPGFSTAASFVNYDILLILAFSLFILGMVLLVKKGLGAASAALVISGVIIGIFAKGTAIVLLPVIAALAFMIAYRKNISKKKIFWYILATTAILAVLVVMFEQNFSLKRIALLSNQDIEQSQKSISDSTREYIAESFSSGRMELTSVMYWGNHRWNNETFSQVVTKAIWLVEALAALGVLTFLLYSKKMDFLPEKRVIILMIIILLALQIGVRFYDWKVFYKTDDFALGAAGRYFMPNIIAHFIVVFSGIGVVLRRNDYFELALKITLILMATFSLYSIFNMIIPRFYL